MHQYKVLLLDFDGVLSDSLAICMEEANKLAGSQDFPTIPQVHSQADMAKLYSVQLRHSLYPFGLDDAQTRAFFDQHSQAMRERAEEVEPFFAVVRALAESSLPKVVITSSYSSAVHHILGKCEGVGDDLLQGVYGREQHKTKTEKIQDALARFGIEMEDALYVGDLVSDILYCRDVPVDIACVGYGYHPADYLRKFDPTHLFATQKEFISFLQTQG